MRDGFIVYNSKEYQTFSTFLEFLKNSNVCCRYRESGTSEWATIPVTPSGSTTVTIARLTPATVYEFQVVGKNALGDGMLSKVITIRTLGKRIRSFHSPRKTVIVHYCYGRTTFTQLATRPPTLILKLISSDGRLLALEAFSRPEP